MCSVLVCGSFTFSVPALSVALCPMVHAGVDGQVDGVHDVLEVEVIDNAGT